MFSQGKWYSIGRARQVARFVSSAKWGWGWRWCRRDDFEICLVELELTKRSKAPKFTQLVFLIGPTPLSRLVDRSLHSPLSCTGSVPLSNAPSPIHPPTTDGASRWVDMGNLIEKGCDDTVPGK